LEQIYAHYLEYAPDTVQKRIDSILQAVEELIFADQWQVDEYDPQSRRIIVDNRFRLLYREVQGGILILRIYSVKQDPRGMQSGE
jgi:plasmid stabilization system protein ParE